MAAGVDDEIAAGRFRQDLYYRLKVVTLTIPPLRRRPTDIPLLAEFYLDAFCKEHGKEPKTLAPETLEVLGRHTWPGNVRELKNVLESAVIFHQGREIGIADLPVELRQSATVSTPGAPVQSPVGQPRSMADIERQAILETLERLDGHRGKAAEALDIGLRTLQRKLKEYKDAGYYLEEEA